MTNEQTVIAAVEALTENGANIKKLNTNTWWVEDNGMWGLLEYQPEGIIMLDDDIIELAEQYVDFNS